MRGILTNKQQSLQTKIFKQKHRKNRTKIKKPIDYH